MCHVMWSDKAVHTKMFVLGNPTDSFFAVLHSFFKASIIETARAATVMVWLLVVIVCGAAVLLGLAWKEVAENATLADLLVQISATQEYLRRVATY